ncbi:FtsX-like permease family protein [Streptomyces sp. 142MFCol3.1]|uniref:FtsX-like permease family protein n=1 Tax=Streptomyces sp. 142MFCol3.1 TaxID=1172179 RepID=UPI00041D0D93|nr:FtsX-like permease family protein [Streptomyces sp. 142MFCol3.1]
MTGLTNETNGAGGAGGTDAAASTGVVAVVAAPWVRTRLRAAPGVAVALALLVAVTACLAAAFPRAVDRYEDAGLRRLLDDATARQTTVQLYAPQPGLELPQAEREQALRGAALRAAYGKVLAAVERPLEPDRAQSSYGVRTTNPGAALDPWLPRPTGLPARMSLTAQNGLADHARLRDGRLPRVRGAVTAATPEVEAAVTTATARTLRIKVGSVIHLPGVERAPLAVRVTGIVEPSEPDGSYWSAMPVLRKPSLIQIPTQGGPPDRYWLGALLLPPDAAPVLLGTAGKPERYWQLAPATASLTAHEVDRLSSAVAALESGPGLGRVRERVDPLADATTDLDDVLTAFDRLRSGIGPLVAVAAFGAGTVAAVVLLMAGGLAVDRRRAELALLRARGGSLRGVAGRLLAETAVVAVPAGALGLAVALLAVPGVRLAHAVAAAVAVTALACATLPVGAAFAHRAVRVHGGREDLASLRPSRRRTVAELTLLVLASGAVVALRRRGASGDQLVALAPVLVGVIAALVLVRLYPLPLRRLARPAGRLRGAVAHLSLARAGRTSTSTVLPLLALLTALTTAAFGGSVLAGVHDARDRAALLVTGADARIEAPHPLPADLPGQVRRASGVREVTPVSIAYEAQVGDGSGTEQEVVALVGVEPGAYGRLARRVGLGGFSGTELAVPAARGSSGTGSAATARAEKRVLPALASPAVAGRYGERPFAVRLEDGSQVTVRITAVRDLTPAVSDLDFLVVDRAGLPARPARPTALFVTGGHLDGGALRDAAGTGVEVRLRAEVRDGYVDSPLQSGAERIYTAAVAAGAGYAVLALLLALVRAAPERTALLARLRTMGLTRAQGRRLLVLEALPQALLAAAGGALTGWAAIRLLSPGIDLRAIALATPDSSSGGAPLRTDAVSLILPSLTVLALATGIAAVQAWWSGRRGSVRELRAGDSR